MALDRREESRLTETAVEPWSSAEALAFLAAAANDPLYPAFVLLMLYGMRHGEVLGLGWHDIDLGREVLHVRQQLQRVSGQLHIGPVKTRAALGTSMGLLSGHGGVCGKVSLRHRLERRWALRSVDLVRLW